jgi:hypothetical protein
VGRVTTVIPIALVGSSSFNKVESQATSEFCRNLTQFVKAMGVFAL